MPGSILCHARAAAEKLFLTADQGQSPDRRAGVTRMRSASNAGLVWSRYLDIWTKGDPPELLEGNERRDVLITFARDFNKRGEMQEPAAVKLLNGIHRRQESVAHGLAEHRGAGTASLQTSLETRFATGLGGPHPTEVGFTFDRTIGIPYLPGSSVKGIARAAAELAGDRATEVLFGPETIDRDSSAETGDLVFLDAYPAAWPRLDVDIINCHHPRYYADRLPFPSETESPVPVYFLTVAPGAAWTFRVLSRSGEHAPRGVDLLRDGLRELGAGAKTAVGYGVFSA